MSSRVRATRVQAIERGLTSFFVALCVILAGGIIALSLGATATKARTERAAETPVPRRTLTLQQAQSALAGDWDRIRTVILPERRRP